MILNKKKGEERLLNYKDCLNVNIKEFDRQDNGESIRDLGTWVSIKKQSKDRLWVAEH